MRPLSPSGTTLPPAPSAANSSLRSLTSDEAQAAFLARRHGPGGLDVEVFERRPRLGEVERGEARVEAGGDGAGDVVAGAHGGSPGRREVAMDAICARVPSEQTRLLKRA